MRWFAIALLLILTACGSSPVRRAYVLNAPADPVARAASLAGRPVLELRRVSVPEYLDTTDILTRDGRNGLSASATGRWGERLSLGIADALAADLDRRLPRWLVVRSASGDQKARQLLVDVDAFEPRPDGNCVLTARWALVDGDQHAVLTQQRDTIVTRVAPAGDPDAAVVAAMGAAIEQLVDKIAIPLALTPSKR
jgi:uncharacterized lipoprotein YmbA